MKSLLFTAAGAAIIGIPVHAYLNDSFADNPGRWAGTRLTCLVGGNGSSKAMHWFDNARYICLK